MDTRKLKHPCDSSKTPAVIFYNGTFSPIHDGHIAALKATKEYLENEMGFEVLGAYLSPAHGSYSRKKLKDQYMLSNHRIEMCLLVADLFDWIMVDTWEMMQVKFKSFDWAMTMAYERLRTHCDFLYGTEFYMIHLSGVDTYRPREFKKIPNYLTVCLVNRDGFDDKFKALVDQKENSKSRGIERAVFVKVESMNISSTIIRNALLNNESVTDYFKMCPQVHQYILDHNIWKTELNPKNIEIRSINKTADELMNNINPENMTYLFQTAHLIDTNTVVKGFDHYQLEPDKSLSGKLFLLSNIIYEPKNDNFIKKIVLKFGGNAGNYNENLESLFYSKYCTDDQMFLNCLAIFQEQKRDIFLFEYVESVHSFDRRDHFDPSLIYIVLRELAAFHSQYINIEALPSIPSMFDGNSKAWLRKKIAKGAFCLRNIFQSYYPNQDLVNVFASRLDTTINKLNDSKLKTLCHNDCWLHNFIVTEDLLSKLDEYKAKAPEEIEHDICQPRARFSGIKIIDFEYTSIGSPLIDVAYFLYNSADSQYLKSYEENLIAFYFNFLCYYGVVDYTFDECMNDYKLAKEYIFIRELPFAGRRYYSGNKKNEKSSVKFNLLYLLDQIIENVQNEIHQKETKKK